MSDKSIRFFRGGSLLLAPQWARVALRSYGAPGSYNCDLGVRLVEEVEDQEPAVLSPFRGSSSFESSNKARTFYSSGSRTLRTPVGIRLVEVIGKSSCVFRGSCSGSEPEFARVTNGNFVGPGFRSVTIGIRLVEVVDD